MKKLSFVYIFLVIFSVVFGGQTISSYIPPYSGGGVPDSITRTRLYADLYNEWADSSLVPGSQYLISDYRPVYDQSQLYNCESSGIIGTIGDIEPLMVTAISSYSFSEYALSTLFPKDIIRYDIGYQKTFSNENPAHGRIYYREDSINNKAWYDWRGVKIYNTKDGLQYSTFNSFSAANSLSFNWEIGVYGLGYDEYPNVIFMGPAFFNESNLISGGSSCPFDTNSATIFYGEFGNNTNNWISASSFYGNVFQNTSLRISGSRFIGNLEQSHNCVINASYFGNKFNKVVNSNFSQSTIIGEIDRLMNCVSLQSTFDGKYYWCSNTVVFVSDIDGDFKGVNNIYWNNTDVNCIVENVLGLADNGSGCGFENCIITGNSIASKFQYINVQTLVLGKTIDEATYPELFAAYPKTIFKGSDNKIYYSYYNGTTTVITEIL